MIRISKHMRAMIVASMIGATACGGAADEQPEETLPETTEPAADATAAAQPASGMLDPNAASADELQTVPNIDAALADALIQGRSYENMLGVDQVLAAQLSEEQRDSVYTRLWIPIDLNTASGEEIMLIPGVGDRMRHEFEEYRPYQAIEQFRREIGKYVDEEEVARLEQYVTIR
ncbi:MAG: hypothetical protein ACRELX_04335 [Longimicrobiales bacterium]